MRRDAFGAALFTGHHGEQVLAVALGLGGLGLGIQFNADHAPDHHRPGRDAPDISGVSTTTIQIGQRSACALQPRWPPATGPVDYAASDGRPLCRLLAVPGSRRLSG